MAGAAGTTGDGAEIDSKSAVSAAVSRGEVRVAIQGQGAGEGRPVLHIRQDRTVIQERPPAAAEATEPLDRSARHRATTGPLRLSHPAAGHTPEGQGGRESGVSLLGDQPADLLVSQVQSAQEICHCQRVSRVALLPELLRHPAADLQAVSGGRTEQLQTQRPV